MIFCNLLKPVPESGPGKVKQENTSAKDSQLAQCSARKPCRNLVDFSWNAASKKLRSKYSQNEDKIAGRATFFNDSYRKATASAHAFAPIKYENKSPNQNQYESVGSHLTKEENEGNREYQEDMSDEDARKKRFFKLGLSEPKADRNASLKFYSSIAEYKLKKRLSYI